MEGKTLKYCKYDIDCTYEPEKNKPYTLQFQNFYDISVIVHALEDYRESAKGIEKEDAYHLLKRIIPYYTEIRNELHGK